MPRALRACVRRAGRRPAAALALLVVVVVALAASAVLGPWASRYLWVRPSGAAAWWASYNARREAEACRDVEGWSARQRLEREDPSAVGAAVIFVHATAAAPALDAHTHTWEQAAERVRHCSDPCRLSFHPEDQCWAQAIWYDAALVDANQPERIQRFRSHQLRLMVNSRPALAPLWQSYDPPWDYLITYARDSDLTYHPACTAIGALLAELQSGVVDQSRAAPDRDRLVAVLIDDCGPDSESQESEQIQAFLRRFVTIAHADVYGLCMRNALLRGTTERQLLDRARRLSLLRRYKFVLVVEQARAVDWLTDGLFDAYAAGAVPVYQGAPNVHRWVPGNHTLLRGEDFHSAPALADHLRALARDHHLMASFAANWSTARLERFHQAHCGPRDLMCEVCQFVARRDMWRAEQRAL